MPLHSEGVDPNTYVFTKCIVRKTSKVSKFATGKHNVSALYKTQLYSLTYMLRQGAQSSCMRQSCLTVQRWH